MPINFIPNDPRAGDGAPAIRVQRRRPNRPATRSDYIFTGTSVEGSFAPGTPQFLFWQCREAAIAALDAWESSGGVHRRWQGDRRRLRLLQDAGEDLNAFYNRNSFSFFHQAIGNETFFSGASTDVVAHEIGHGLLDSIRADFFGVSALEVGAFHEAFGDCMAVLTALSDSETRQKLLAAVPDLRGRNFVEATAEDLSFGIKLQRATHNAAEPRHAFNTFQYQLPQTLPANGGPGALINEEHSFGMIFSGCFWDVIANIFNAGAVKTEAALASAAVLAGRILIAATRSAVITARFLQSVGRAMVLADQTLNAGANRDHIRNAFLAHGILLGTNSMMAPTMALAGAAPNGAVISAATRKDLMQRLGAGKGSRLSLAAENLFGTPVVKVALTREVSLSALDKRLTGVMCVAHDCVNIGQSGGRAAVIGMMPHTAYTDSELQEYVKMLLVHDRIDFGRQTGAVGGATFRTPATHAIRSVRGRRMLVRVRFLCGCR